MNVQVYFIVASYRLKPKMERGCFVIDIAFYAVEMLNSESCIGNLQAM